MKPLIAVLAAAGVAAVLFLRPGGRAEPAAPSWQAATPPARSHPAAGADPAGSSPALVYVVGAVARPGVYRIAAGGRVRDGISAAGGLRAGADPVAVNLAAHVRDGEEIVVPLLGATMPANREGFARPGSRRRTRKHAGVDGAGDTPVDPYPGAGERAHGKRRHGGRAHREAAPSALIDLNAADAETLSTVPGIGPGLALRIVAFRDANGPFASADELLDVAGITDRRLDAILPYVVAR